MTFRWIWICVVLFILAVLHIGPGTSTTLVFGFIPLWYLWTALLGLLVLATFIIFAPAEPFTEVPEQEVD